MPRFSRLAPLLAVLALAGCGGTAQRHNSVPASGTACQPGNSFMGCSIPHGFAAPRLLTIPAGRKFIDVSDWQPNVNWRAVRAAGVFGVVVKAGEGLAPDWTFAEHVAGAKAAGLAVQAYWFVRNVGCAGQLAAIRSHTAGLPVTLDIEVPGTAGYAWCLRAGAHAVYTSPGTWPGGSTGGLPLWQAEYGPVLHPHWLPVKAWQFTSHASIAGLTLDESVDYGLFPVPVVHPARVLPMCVHKRESLTACAAVKAKIASDRRAVADSKYAGSLTKSLLARERCVRPYRRGFCIRWGRDARVFAQRVRWFSAAIRRLEAAN